MARNEERGKLYVKQAQERSLQLAGLLATAEAGKADWPTIRGIARSLQANLESAVADLSEEPQA